MKVVDTSVVVAGFGPWHEHHDAARQALSGAPRLVGHVGLEAFSVLTRLPAPFRASPAVVREYLERRFEGPVLVLPAEQHPPMLDAFAARGVAGGAVYDGLVGWTARSAGAVLVTLDRRASATYAALGIDVDELG